MNLVSYCGWWRSSDRFGVTPITFGSRHPSATIRLCQSTGVLQMCTSGLSHRWGMFSVQALQPLHVDCQLCQYNLRVLVGMKALPIFWLIRLLKKSQSWSYIFQVWLHVKPRKPSNFKMRKLRKPADFQLRSQVAASGGEDRGSRGLQLVRFLMVSATDASGRVSGWV